MDNGIIAKGITTLGQVLGVTQETITEPHSQVTVTVADKAAEKARRIKQWFLELTARATELTEWCVAQGNTWVTRREGGVRKAINTGNCCDMCAKLKPAVQDQYEVADDTVIFSQMLAPDGLKGLGYSIDAATLQRHNDYHLSVALTAKHNAEWSARAIAREERQRKLEEQLLKGIVDEVKVHHNPGRKGTRHGKTLGYNKHGHRSNPHKK